MDIRLNKRFEATLGILLSTFFLLMGCERNSKLPQDAVPVPNPLNASETNAALQREKLQLEIEDLRSKTSFGVFNQPLVLTVLTLLISGLAFAYLSDRRAKQSKRLEQAVGFVNEVGADLNAVVTPLFRYIRMGNHEDKQPTSDQEREKIRSEQEKLFSRVSKSIPRLFEKRVSVSVKTKAFLPLKCRRFSQKYVRLCQELDRILDKLQDIGKSTEARTYDDEIKGIKELKKKLNDEWPLEHRCPSGQARGGLSGW
jgi:hypothetical protein